MDIRRLNHLVALAEERSFSRAAARVHLSQPAFSRSVQAAEAELGLQLFDRGTVEVNCTAAGAFVIERARRLVFDKRCLERDVLLYRERQMGDVAFGVGPFPAATILPRLMMELRTRFANIHSRVEVNNWKYLMEHLRAEELDFFVSDVRDLPRDPAITVTSLGRQHGRFFVRAGHPLARRRKVRPDEMLAHGLATVRLPEDIRKLLRRMFGTGERTPLPLALECDDVHLLKQVALGSDTVLGVVDAAVRDELASGQLHALPLVDMPPLYSEMGVVSLTGRSFSPMAEFAADFFRQLMKQEAA